MGGEADETDTVFNAEFSAKSAPAAIRSTLYRERWKREFVTCLREERIEGEKESVCRMSCRVSITSQEIDNIKTTGCACECAIERQASSHERVTNYRFRVRS